MPNPTDIMLAELRDQRTLLHVEADDLYNQVVTKRERANAIDRVILRLESDLVTGMPKRTLPGEPS